MRVTSAILLLARVALCLAAALARADEQPVVPPDEFVYCTVCHGVQLKGNPVIQAPRLSGMAEWYARAQLLAFARGWRGTHEKDVYGMEMRPMAAALSAAEIGKAAGFVASVSSGPAPLTVNTDVEAGRSLYVTCAVCHGADGDGNEAMHAPALTGTNDWYLVRQLLNFRDGARGAHAEDTYGMQMRAAAQVLPDEGAINDVVTYINSLRKR